jgi:hypothetical protein
MKQGLFFLMMLFSALAAEAKVSNTAIASCAELSAVVYTPNTTSACEGDSIELSADVFANVSSQWYKDGQPFGMPNAETVYATASGVYHLEVTNELLQCNHAYEDIVVQINPLPQVSAGPDLTFCEGDVWYFYANGDLEYSWSNVACNGCPSLISENQVVTLFGIDGNGCSNSDTLMVTVSPSAIYFFDGDGDGFGNINSSGAFCIQPSNYVANSSDCNDNNVAINANASEICNGIDENCNGQSDDGLLFVNYYIDFDLDGFGNLGNMQNACAQPFGFVPNALDCNDVNSYVNPEAIEICNGLDEDCDGENDNSVVFATFYEDTDGDTYGDPATGQYFCLIPTELFVDNGDDCDDTNALVNPAATEVWENGIDDDCNPNTTDVGVDEWSAAAFSLFPNPATDRVTLSLTSTVFSSIEIFNSLGALVHSSNVLGSQTSIDVSVFPAGYYVVRVNGTSKTFVKL